MRRNLSELSGREYDLVIVGGGIFGVCAAWDATLRGLSVALVERGDFCQATSANHLKVVHGGIRYLQHLDIYRILESNKERNALLRIAPHLVQPLPIIVPTYGHGMQGKEILSVGLMIYDLMVFNRNKGLNDPDRRIPKGHIISRRECLELFPDLERKNLTGAGVLYDGQMYNPPRLVLSYLRSAMESGAQAANYLEATDFLRKGDRVVGVKVRDRITSDEFEIRCKVVLNASGPWAERLLESKMGIQLSPQQTYSRDACFVIPRRLTGKYALAVQGSTSDPDAILSRKQRHIFIVPWRDYTLIGVWHVVFKGSPDEFTVTDEELQSFLDEVNQGYPHLNLKLGDISMWNAGLVLFGDNKPGATELSYGKRSLLVDHAKEHNLQGLITLIGVRATTARGKAVKGVDLAFKKLGKNVPKSKTDVTPIYGGQIECFEEFLSHAIERRPSTLDADVMRPLLHNYGSKYGEVLKYIKEDRILAEKIGTSKILKAEVIHGVREEMAQKLVDIVFRRTDLGTACYPGDDAIKVCAELMASEMGWNDGRVQREIDEVRAAFPFLNKNN
jgi:glycerol-3-phosphate dehydrogenase